MSTKAVLKKIAAACFVLAAVAQSHAGYISGEIQFSGTAILDGPIDTANQITGYSGTIVLGGSPTGSYSAIPGATPVTWTPFTFDPAASSVSPLWKISYLGLDYWFDATSVSVVTQNSMFLNIVGSGIAYIDGFDATPGSWQITVNGGTANFSFGAYTSASIPDGGIAVGMLAASLSGLWMFRRKLSV